MCRESNIDFENYIIKKDGIIIGKRYGKELSTNTLRGGYVENSFKCKDGICRTYDRHRVIWYYFNGEIPSEMEVGHKDSNPTNNSLDNLYLCSHKENMNNPITLERNKNSGRPKTAINVFKNGVLIGYFESQNDAARELNIGRFNIYNCLNKTRKQTKGYTFEFA